MAELTQQSWPLSEEHCDCLDQCARDLAQIESVLQRCQECGLNVNSLAEKCSSQQRLIGMLKEKFFPHRQ